MPLFLLASCSYKLLCMLAQIVHFSEQLHWLHLLRWVNGTGLGATYGYGGAGAGAGGAPVKARATNLICRSKMGSPTHVQTNSWLQQIVGLWDQATLHVRPRFWGLRPATHVPASQVGESTGSLRGNFQSLH